MATENDKVNSGALGTIVAVGTFATLAIALAVDALVRYEVGTVAAERAGLAAIPYHSLVKEQREKLEAGRLPIERAMSSVVIDLQRDPWSATPPAPEKDAGADTAADADAGVEGDAGAAEADAGTEGAVGADGAPLAPAPSTPPPAAPSATVAPAPATGTAPVMPSAKPTAAPMVPSPTPTAAPMVPSPTPTAAPMMPNPKPTATPAAPAPKPPAAPPTSDG